MKIEKINENQIKFTLTRSDLASRQIRLSELTYGTEKAKGLFQDMMELANMELGYDISEFPLMIEAIPVSMDCIVLMITMVDNPDEVDHRFSDLADLSELLKKDSPDEFDFSSFFAGPPSETADFGKTLKTAVHAESGAGECLFSFDSLDCVIDLARSISGYIFGESSLYKSPESGKYFLRIQSDPEKKSDFSRIIAISSEFGTIETLNYSRIAYMDEHFEKIMSENALTALAQI